MVVFVGVRVISALLLGVCFVSALIFGISHKLLIYPGYTSKDPPNQPGGRNMYGPKQLPISCPATFQDLILQLFEGCGTTLFVFIENLQYLNSQGAMVLDTRSFQARLSSSARYFSIIKVSIITASIPLKSAKTDFGTLVKQPK